MSRRTASVALLLTLAACTAPPAVEPGRAAGLVSAIDRLLTDPKAVLQPDGSTALDAAVSSVEPPYRILWNRTNTWIHVVMKEEAELLALGSPAVEAISEALRDSGRNWELRARLAILLGRLGDRRAAVTLLDVARQERHSLIRQCCWTGVGLLKSPELLPELRRTPEHGISDRGAAHWAMGMSGCEGSKAEYLDRVAGVLSREDVEEVIPSGKIPTLWVSDGQSHLNLRARKSAENEFLDLDLWRAAHFRSPRVLRMLMDALGYHNLRMQHMAEALLSRDIEGGPKFPGTFEYELRTLKIQSAWRRWWDLHGTSLQWDPSVQKYRIAG